MEKRTSKKRQLSVPLLIAVIFVINLALLIATRSSYPSTFEFLGEAIWVVNGLIFAVVGGLILIRQRRHVVGWLLMVLPIMVTVSAILDFFLKQSTLASVQLDALGFLYLWFGGWSWWLLIGPLLLIFLLYPTGHLRSKRWRWVVALLAAAFVLFLFVVTFAGTAEDINGGQTWPNPIGFLSDESVNILVGIMSILLVASVLASVASTFVRYRNAQALERAQMRWLFLAGAFFMIVYLPGFVVQDNSVWSSWFGYLFVFGVATVPIAIGIAILRYHLWDIDVVINRSLVYAVLTTLLAAIFAATAAVLTQTAKAAFGSGMEQGAAAVAAIFVASIFQPLRAWVETGINRRLFPENIDLSQGLVEINPDFWDWVGLPKIMNATLDHLEDIYSCSAAAIYLKKSENEFFPVAALGIPVSKLELYKPNKEEQELFLRKRGIISEKAEPFAISIPIHLPRRNAAEILGVLRLGKRKQGRGYSGDDVKTLVSFGAKLGQPVYAFASARKT